MKKLILLFGAGFLSLASHSQATISNQSFETWQNIVVKDSLDEWFTSTLQFQNQGVLDVNNAYGISPGYSSSTALHLETILHYNAGSGMDDTLFGYAINEAANGPDFVGFPYSDTVDLFTCWYKCGIVGGDQGLIVIELSNNNVPYSTTTYPIVGTQSSWMQLNIPLLGGASEVPDSVFIGFVSSDPFTPGVAEPGSWLEVDQISFSFTGGSVIPGPIPNNSFENWTTETIEQPTGWFSFDPQTYFMTDQVYSSKSLTAQHGSYSLQIETTFENLVFAIPSLVTNGYYDGVMDSIIGGTPFNAQPSQFIGQFQYSPVFTDTAWIYVDFWNSTSGIHVEGYDTLLSAGVWTPFIVDLTFTEAPDSVKIIFFSGANAGSTLWVDHLQFTGGDVNTPDMEMTAQNLVVYPNPSTDQVAILFAEADVINVYDMNGRLISQSSNIVGNKIHLATADWENGIYVIQLINNGKVETKKLTVQH